MGALSSAEAVLQSKGLCIRYVSFVCQVVDAAISESVFNMLEGCVPEFAMHGYDRPPSGSTISGELAIAPKLLQASSIDFPLEDCSSDTSSCIFREAKELQRGHGAMLLTSLQRGCEDNCFFH